MINYIRKKLRKRKNKLYNENLIDRLVKDHKTLIKLFEKLKSNPNIKTLHKFIDELQLHLLLENTNLYENLEHRYSLCSSAESIVKIKEEISSITPIVSELENLIINNISDRKKIDDTLLLIEAYLIKRISFEEEILFAVYQDYLTCDELKKIFHFFMESDEEETTKN